MSRVLSLSINGEAHEVEVLTRGSESVRFRINGREYLVEHKEEVLGVASRTEFAPRREVLASLPIAPGKSGLITAVLPGVVVEILVKEGQVLAGGEVVLRLEAMKMQNNIFAPEKGGKVKHIYVSPGEEVSDGQALMEIGIPETGNE